MKKWHRILKKFGRFSKILYIIVSEIIDEGKKSKRQKQYRRTQTNIHTTPKTQTLPEKIDIKKLYHELALKYHPDGAVNEVDKKFRTQLFVKIKSAYDRGDIKTLQAYKLD